MKRAGSDDALRCSFCHKSQDVVGKLISSPSDYPRAYICDECIAVCNSILEDDKVEPQSGAPNRIPKPLEVKESQRGKAVQEVKASLLLSRIAEREAIGATRDEVDKEIERVARQERQPVAAVQMRFEKDGTLRRIADRIQTEKTLGFLFEHARKTAE